MLRRDNQNNKMKRRTGRRAVKIKTNQKQNKPLKATKQNTNKIMDSFDDEDSECYSSNEGSLSPSFYGECSTSNIDHIREERRVPTMVLKRPTQQEEKKNNKQKTKRKQQNAKKYNSTHHNTFYRNNNNEQ